jgi:hypothetical protein
MGYMLEQVEESDHLKSTAAEQMKHHAITRESRDRFFYNGVYYRSLINAVAQAKRHKSILNPAAR